MSIVNGTFINLYIDKQVVFMAKSTEETAKRDLIETTSKFSGGNASFMYGKFGSQGNAEGFFAEVPTNLLVYNTVINNAAWDKVGCTATDNDDTDQNGAELAATIAGWGSTDSLTQSISGINGTSKTVTFSVWLKGTGTLTLSISDDGDSASTAATLTGTLTRYSLSFVTTGDASDVVCGFVRAADTATTFVMASAMLNEGTLKDYQPSGVMYSALFTAVRNKTLIDIVTGSYEDGSDIYEGQAVISDLARAFPMEDAVTYTLGYTITGELAQTTI